MTSDEQYNDPQQFVAELKALLLRWDAELQTYDGHESIFATLKWQTDEQGTTTRPYHDINLGRIVGGE